MNDWEVIKCLKESSKNGVMEYEARKKLFKQYDQDKANNVPPEESVARTVLILGNERLIGKTMLKYLVGFDHVDTSSEIYSAGKTGLVYAVDNFKPNLNISFSTYAMAAIRDKLFLALKENNKNHYQNVAKVYEIPFTEIQKPDDDDNRRFEIADEYNLSEDVTKRLTKLFRQRKILENLKYLQPREQDILIHHFSLCGVKKIPCYLRTEEFGVGRQGSYVILQNAINKLNILIKQKNLTPDEKKKLKNLQKHEYVLIPEIEALLAQNMHDFYYS